MKKFKVKTKIVKVTKYKPIIVIDEKTNKQSQE